MREPLSVLFPQQPELAWALLDMESSLQVEDESLFSRITCLIAVYARFIERLNSSQDPRQVYFNKKMKKLMAEPYVIRCFEVPSPTHSLRRQHEQNVALLTEKLTKNNISQIIVDHSNLALNQAKKVELIVQQQQEHLLKRILTRKKKIQSSQILNEEQAEFARLMISAAKPKNIQKNILTINANKEGDRASDTDSSIEATMPIENI